MAILSQRFRKWTWSDAKREAVDRLSNIGFEALKSVLTNPRQMIEIKFRDDQNRHESEGAGNKILNTFRDPSVIPSTQEEAILAMIDKAKASKEFAVRHRKDHLLWGLLSIRNKYTEIRRQPAETRATPA